MITLNDRFTQLNDEELIEVDGGGLVSGIIGGIVGGGIGAMVGVGTTAVGLATGKITTVKGATKTLGMPTLGGLGWGIAIGAPLPTP